MSQIQGNSALVTGASSGMGAAIAWRLACEGVKVALVARRADRLDDLVARISTAGGTALAIPADLTDDAAAIGAVEHAIAQFGGLDILVNSAGMSQAGNVEAGDLDEFRATIDLNLLAAVYTCRAAIPTMKARASGDIINISSMASKTDMTGAMAYGLSKRAVEHLSAGLRRQLGPHGVRVCTLVPGRTRTEFAEGIRDPEARSRMREYLTGDALMEPEDIAATVLHILNLPRFVNVAEIVMHVTGDSY